MMCGVGTFRAVNLLQLKKKRHQRGDAVKLAVIMVYSKGLIRIWLICGPRNTHLALIGLIKESR